MYTLLFDFQGHKSGTMVYDPVVYDYGWAKHCTRLDSGIEHISVTLDPSGGYPIFTLPRSYLESVS